MKKWEEVFKDVQELSNGERFKLLGKMYDTYFHSRPSEEVMKKELCREMYGDENED